MLRFQHDAMATQFEIRCTHPDSAYARQAALAAFAVVDRMEQLLSRFIENSDISRINRLRAGSSTRVSYETMQCLMLSRQIQADTDGAFDPSLGTGFGTLDLAPVSFVVSPTQDGVWLDLGAIGKGYALDRAASVLREWNVDHALIDSGASSVLALEPPAGEAGWPLTFSDPRDPRVVLIRRTARQAALSASGIRKGDHIIDPRSGAPVRSRPAAWVAAPIPVLTAISDRAGVESSPAAVADALSTAFMVGSTDDVAAYCARHPGLEAWILDDRLRHWG